MHFNLSRDNQTWCHSLTELEAFKIDLPSIFQKVELDMDKVSLDHAPKSIPFSFKLANCTAINELKDLHLKPPYSLTLILGMMIRPFDVYVSITAN